jgi:hypothetical protein
VNAPLNRLLLGPIVGHTDSHSTRVWVRVRDNPEAYRLRVTGIGLFVFVSTEGRVREFGTALAIADGLHPDRHYKYQVLRHGRVVPGAFGTFRTLPKAGSFADVLFISISCSRSKAEGAWPLLERFMWEAKPRFIIMLGDQVYLDYHPAPTWPPSNFGTREGRRRAMAKKYQDHWSREPVRTIMANFPTYMMWDDHDIRDGWGTWASDSPTLQQRYSLGAKIAEEFNGYFEDARTVYWHFQMCHNLESFTEDPFIHNRRQAIPVFFRCGRLLVLMLDVRGDKDLWRETGDRVLGHYQWSVINDLVAHLPPDVDALAIVTPTPIVSMSPVGEAQRRLGGRTDDVKLFSQGKRLALLGLQGRGLSLMGAAGALADRLLLKDILPDNDLMLNSFDEIRDNWAHALSRPEQEKLIRKMAEAMTTNRTTPERRGGVFIGGDVHAGAIFNIAVSEPELNTECLITSGIGQRDYAPVGFTFDEDFEVAKGIRAGLEYVANDYNFGVTHILFNAGTPVINNVVAHAGAASYVKSKLP